MKTIIALFVIANKLSIENKKILFLAPTKPLVTQHASFINSFLEIDSEDITLFTGEVTPKKRIDLWKNNKIIISTPQVIENDLISNRITLMYL